MFGILVSRAPMSYPHRPDASYPVELQRPHTIYQQEEEPDESNHEVFSRAARTRRRDVAARMASTHQTAPLAHRVLDRRPRLTENYGGNMRNNRNIGKQLNAMWMKLCAWLDSLVGYIFGHAVYGKTIVVGTLLMVLVVVVAWRLDQSVAARLA
jgi:hypothetical protein